MTVPPCDHCGQPWAHRFEGAPVKRNIRKVIVLAVLGGLAAQIPFIVFAAYVYVGLTRPIMMASSGGAIPAGPLRPALQACTLFDRWEATAGSNTNLLNRAVADAHSPRVPFARQLKTRLKADLGGLRSEIRQASYTHSRMKTVSYEQAIQAECAPFIADYRHVRRHHNGLHRPRPGPRHSAITHAVRAPPPGN